MSRLQTAFAAALGIMTMMGTTTVLAASLPMPIQGATSQPVGHFDFCKRYADQCGRTAEQALVTLSRNAWDTIVEVNEAVNGGISPRTDQDMQGVAEYWSYPTSEGDCEDYALLKQYMLERAGLPRSALLVTVVRQPSGEGHAVLTVRTDKGDFILDNLDERVLDWTQTDYRYLKRQSQKNAAKWVAVADDRDVLVGSVR